MTALKTFVMRGLGAGALMLLGVTLHAADWPAAHQNPSNNAVAPVAAQVTSLAGAPAYFTGNEFIVNGAPITIANGRFYAPAHQADGSTTQVTVICFNAEDGALLWESAPLDQGLSLAFGSTSAVAVDAANSAAFYATGNTVYRWNAQTGAPAWSTVLDDTNTATSPTVQRWDVVNSSITIGGGRLFVETYGGFQPNYKQIVALDAATGNVLWFQNDEGQGVGTPVYVEAGVNSRVYTAGVNAVYCYNAVTGALIWDSALTPTATWDVGSWEIFSSITENNGRIYVAAGDPFFSATTTTLICADGLTGEKLWEAPGLHSDIPPLVLDGKVYVYGGGFPGRLASFDALTGAAGIFVTVAPNDFIFRDYMAATQDRIYLTDGVFGGQMLKIIDPATGAILDSAAGYVGPVTVDSLGGLYVHDLAHGNSVSTFGTTVPVEVSEFTVE